jgi:hypothetical protein
MVSISDELKERRALKLILIVRFACATLDVGHPIIPLFPPSIAPPVQYRLQDDV